MLYGSYSYCTLGEGPNATVTKSAKWCVNAGAKLEICLIEGDVGDGMEVEAGHATGILVLLYSGDPVVGLSHPQPRYLRCPNEVGRLAPGVDNLDGRAPRTYSKGLCDRRGASLKAEYLTLKDAFREKAVQCLILARYTTGGPYRNAGKIRPSVRKREFPC